MKNIIIIGSSGHAKVVIDTIEEEGKYKIVGLCDRFREVGEETEGYTVIGQEEDLPNLKIEHSIYGVVVAIGDNFVRSKVTSMIKELCPSLKFISAIHPHTSIAKNVNIGEGTIIVAGVVVNSNAVIGNSCILNTAASLGHDAALGDFASIGPGSRIAGNCNIGKLSSIGMGAVVIEKINIGEETVIGASATVNKDIDPRVVAYGTPVKVIRTRQSGEGYLR